FVARLFSPAHKPQISATKFSRRGQNGEKIGKEPRCSLSTWLVWSSGLITGNQARRLRISRRLAICRRSAKGDKGHDHQYCALAADRRTHCRYSHSYYPAHAQHHRGRLSYPDRFARPWAFSLVGYPALRWTVQQCF